MRYPILLVSSLLLVLCAAAGAQTTVTVNRLGGANFRTITDAIAATAAGDTIRVQGMVDANGPLAYDNSSTYPNLPPETFPLQPLGRTVEADPTTPPVYIWDVSGAPVTLIEISPQPGAPVLTVLRKLRLTGGEAAVSIPLGSGNDSSTELDQVVFLRNLTALKVRGLDGGSIGFDALSRLVLNDCKIADAPPTPWVTNPPFLRDPEFGIDLEAISTTAGNPSSRIRIQASNLQTVGPFQSIAPTATLIRLYAKGTPGRSEHRNGYLNPAPIPHVIVELDGGDLSGWATPADPGRGWSVGIDASADKITGAQPPYSYVAAFEVRSNGCKLRNFREQGLVGITTGKYLRGHFILSGGTEVSGIGIQTNGVPPNDISRQSGVFMDCNEGYLSIHTRDSAILDNAGNGIGLRCGALTLADTEVPWGLYVDIVRTEIHENGQEGIHMWANSQSIVGGTWSYHPVTGARLILSGREVLITSGGPDPTLAVAVPKGQGRIDACAISNNGTPGTYEGHGIRMTLANGAGGPAEECIGACRMTNNIVWNHSAEGILFEVQEPGPQLCTLLSPVLHCTLAGNGGASNGMGGVARTIEVTHPDKVTFNWNEPGTQMKLNTKFYNSIFLGKAVGDQVFGDSVAAGYVDVDPYGNPANDLAVIRCRGLRTSQAQTDDYGEVDWQIPGKQGWWTADPPPFVVWPPNLASTDSTQFYLASGTGDGFEETPFFMGPFTPPDEILQDIQPVLRPALLEPGSNPPTSLRDKGAHQR